MKTFDTQFNNKNSILALGAESAGNFSFYDKDKIYCSEDFGDLFKEKNFEKFQKAVLDFMTNNGKPDVIISDLHPLFHTTSWGKELSDKFGAEFIQVQHHLAHIYSAVGDNVVSRHSGLTRISKDGLDSRLRGNDKQEFIGIACDGTGYGFDEKIWGGEVFKIHNSQFTIHNSKTKSQVERIGHLENQTLISGELAIKEPARMLIGILGKFLGKDEVYSFVKDFYSKNEYELLYNQWKQGFNCLETSSTGRVLDAVSVLLGFSGNEREYKHAPIENMERNSGEPYEIEPEIKGVSELSSRDVILATTRSPESDNQTKKNDSGQARMTHGDETDCLLELQTTPLFEYLVQNLEKDKKRLAATSQMYLAKGLWEIILCHSGLDLPRVKAGQESIQEELDSRSESGMTGKGRDVIPVFFAGGIANNKIISEYLVSKGVIVSKEIPRGDAGISFGQLVYFLSAPSTDHS